MQTKRFLRYSRRAMKRGFTLIEMLLVIALIVLLSGVVVTNVDGLFGESKASVVKVMVNNSFEPALMAYRTREGRYPQSLDQIASLLKGGVVKPDPWGNPYNFMAPGKHNVNGYDLWSSGPDGQSGTADDIGNW